MCVVRIFLDKLLHTHSGANRSIQLDILNNTTDPSWSKPMSTEPTLESIIVEYKSQDDAMNNGTIVKESRHLSSLTPIELSNVYFRMSCYNQYL